MKTPLLIAGVAMTLSACAAWQAGFYGDAASLRIGGPPPTATPQSTRSNPDGSRTLEYSDQPWGDRCTLVTVGADGRVIASVDAYAEENLARIVVGMSIAEVQRLLCQHHSIEHYPRLGEEVWDWNIRNAGMGYGVRFNVHFNAAGVVVRTSRTLYDNDRRRFPWM